MTAPTRRSTLRFPELHTLRFRLTVGYLLVFGVVQVVLWLVVHFILARRLYDRFDHDMLHKAQTISETFEAADKRDVSNAPPETFKEAMKPFETDDSYLLVFFVNEKRTVRSSNLRGVKFPHDAASVDGTRAPHFTTLQGPFVDPLSAGEPLRLLTLDVDYPPAPYYLQLAVNYGPLQGVMADIQRLLLFFVVISLLIAAITSWFMATRSLAPISAIARAAKEYSTKRMSERIPVPAVVDETSELVVTINEMLDRLENQIKLQQAFIASASHELKTPLAVLLGEIQSQRNRAATDPDLAAFTNSLEEEVRKLLRIVETFLIMTRSRATRRLEVVTDVAIEDAIVTAIRKCRYDATGRDVKVVPKFSTEEGLADPVISGDADLIVSMIENLLSNAIRHSPAGGTVEIEGRSTFKEVQICVRDQGPGIPEEHHSRIFEQGYQIAPEGKFTGKSGTGLAIVTAVVDVHGGSISVRNRDTGGCEFAVRLPLAG